MEPELKAEIRSALALIEELSAKSSDSGLSEETCWELFGGPCPEALRKGIKRLEEVEETEEAFEISPELRQEETENERPTAAETLTGKENILEVISSVGSAQSEEEIYRSVLEDLQSPKGTILSSKMPITDSNEKFSSIKTIQSSQAVLERKSFSKRSPAQKIESPELLTAKSQSIKSSKEKSQADQIKSIQSKTSIKEVQVFGKACSCKSNKKQLSDELPKTIPEDSGADNTEPMLSMQEQQSLLAIYQEKSSGHRSVLEKISSPTKKKSSLSIEKLKEIQEISNDIKRSSQVDELQSPERISQRKSLNNGSAEKAISSLVEKQSFAKGRTSTKQSLEPHQSQAISKEKLSKEKSLNGVKDSSISALKSQPLEDITQQQTILAEESIASPSKKHSSIEGRTLIDKPLSPKALYSPVKEFQSPEAKQQSNILTLERVKSLSAHISIEKSLSPKKPQPIEEIKPPPSTTKVSSELIVIKDIEHSTIIPQKSVTVSKENGGSKLFSTIGVQKHDTVDEPKTSSFLEKKKPVSPIKPKPSPVLSDKIQQTIPTRVKNLSTSISIISIKPARETTSSESFQFELPKQESTTSYLEQRKCNCCCCASGSLKSFNEKYQINIFTDDQVENVESDKKFMKITSFGDDKVDAKRRNKRLQTSVMTMQEKIPTYYPHPYEFLPIPSPQPQYTPKTNYKIKSRRAAEKNACRCAGDYRNHSESTESETNLSYISSEEQRTQSLGDSLRSELQRRSNVQKAVKKFENRYRAYSPSYEPQQNSRFNYMKRQANGACSCCNKSREKSKVNRKKRY